MTDELDPKTFNVDEWLSGATRVTKMVEVYGRPHLQAEIDELHAYGVARIFSPEDGQRLGLAGMINSMIEACDVDPALPRQAGLSYLSIGRP